MSGTGPAPVDLVNHPPHYTSDPSGVECITITRHRNFNIGNAFKYLWRNGLKDSPIGARAKQIQDLEKSIFYIQDEIKRLKALPETSAHEKVLALNPLIPVNAHPHLGDGSEVGTFLPYGILVERVGVEDAQKNPEVLRLLEAVAA